MMRKLLVVLVLLSACADDSGVQVTCAEAFDAFCEHMMACSVGWDFDGDHLLYQVEQCKRELITSEPGGYPIAGNPGSGIGCLYDDGQDYTACRDASLAVTCDDLETSGLAASNACARPLTE